MSTLCLPHVHLRLGRIIELRSGTGDVWKNDDVSVAPNPHAFVEGVQKQLGAKLYRSTSPLHFRWTLYHYVIHHVMYLTMPHHFDDTWCSCHIFFAPMQIYTFLYVSVTKRFWDRCEWSLKSYFSDQWPGHISSITLNWYPRRCDAVQQFTAIFLVVILLRYMETYA